MCRVMPSKFQGMRISLAWVFHNQGVVKRLSSIIITRIETLHNLASSKVFSTLDSPQNAYNIHLI